MSHGAPEQGRRLRVDVLAGDAGRRRRQREREREHDRARGDGRDAVRPRTGGAGHRSSMTGTTTGVPPTDRTWSPTSPSTSIAGIWKSPGVSTVVWISGISSR